MEELNNHFGLLAYPFTAFAVFGLGVVFDAGLLTLRGLCVAELFPIGLIVFGDGISARNPDARLETELTCL